MGKTFRGENHRLVREARRNKRQGFVFRSTEVKKPKYEIWLKIGEEVFCHYFFPYDIGVLEY